MKHSILRALPMTIVAMLSVGIAASAVTSPVVYTGCQNLATGIIRLLPSSLPAPYNNSCNTSTTNPLLKEQPISWNQVGPAGPAGPAGSQGLQGPQGPQGVAGPAGLQGPKGDKGDGFVWKGTYDGAKSYAINDVVQLDGATYVATAPVPATCQPGQVDCVLINAPPLNTAWQLVAGRGDKGDKGDTGMQGAVGPAGPAGGIGPAGPAGPAGPVGPAGVINAQLTLQGGGPVSPVAATFATLTLPEGTYLVFGRLQVQIAAILGGGFLICSLDDASGNAIDVAIGGVLVGGAITSPTESSTLSLMSSASFSPAEVAANTNTVRVRCQSTVLGVGSVSLIKLYALPINSLILQ